MELDRILQSQGFGSRKECRGLVRHGLVTIAGKLCEDPFEDFATEALVLDVDGEIWPYHAQAYLMINKPVGYEVSQKPKHHRSVFELLPDPIRARGVQAIGRLDEDTTGLLILTDDGQLIHQISSPKRKIPKVYEVTLKHPVEAALIEALLAGVELHDDPEPVAAASCEATGEHTLKLTITSGKYHQVKRMIGAAGNRVDALKRIAVGRLVIPDTMQEGGWAWLSEADLAALRCEPA